MKSDSSAPKGKAKAADAPQAGAPLKKPPASKEPLPKPSLKKDSPKANGSEKTGKSRPVPLDAPKKAAPSKSPGRPAAKMPGPAPATGLDQTVQVFTHFERFLWDIGGILLVSAALMTSLAMVLPDLTSGVLLSWWRENLTSWLGWGGLWIALVTGLAGLWMLRRPLSGGNPRPHWGRLLALEAALFASLALLTALGGNSVARAEAGLDGGRIGWGIAELLNIFLDPLGPVGHWIEIGLLLTVLLVGLWAGLGMSQLMAWLRRELAYGTGDDFIQPGAASSEGVLPGPAVSEAPLNPVAAVPGRPNQKKPPVIEEQYRPNLPPPPPLEEPQGPPPSRDGQLPPLDLLTPEQVSRPDDRHINQTAGMIVKTLAEFGIPAKVVGYRIGPTVTQFAIEPGFVEKPGVEGDNNRQKVRVSQISALQRDLTLALAAERLRIEAPVPGRPYVGIEVPNQHSTIVRMRPVIESEAFYKIGAPLTIALGRDVSGQPVAADLSRMPHLLVAGTTGSGKSVCIEAITACLVMNNTPEDLRLVMVDPKMVELVRFNGLPHLLGKVETDVERIMAVLRWAVAEMDRRYKLLESAHARNIETYNRKVRRKAGETPMPRLVLMIDELADLMMSAPDQTEHTIVRLAQMARAVGIHLVVATQRPSTDVVTGLIKANFPARIAFAVASSIDSRVILDTTGAESLLGRGDMLFLPPEASAPIRCQGVLVSDAEVEKVIAFWQKTLPVNPQDSASPWDEMLEQEAVLADRDGLVEKAAAIVRETQRANASMLQRRLRIGYPRAAHLIDELEELGVVGPATSGGREREVLIGPNDELPFKPAAGNEADFEE